MELLLHELAGGGSDEAVAHLLNRGCDPNKRGAFGRGALHFAATFDAVNVIRLLVSRQAEVELKDDQGNTALHCAAEHNRLGALKALIESGANISSRNRDGRTPLCVASLAGHIAVVAELEDAYIKALALRSKRNQPSNNQGISPHQGR
jgi:ankyrin repeat protein